jgi:hypothetical protein
MRILLAALISLFTLGAGVALAVTPKPGPFTGKEKIPYNGSKTQPLQFTMGGDGHKMYAFDVPVCEVKGEFTESFFATRVVRPKVSKSGHIHGRLAYRKGNSKKAFTDFSVHVSGRFVTPTRAKGRVTIKATKKTFVPGSKPTVEGKPCRASGSWKAKRD